MHPKPSVPVAAPWSLTWLAGLVPLAFYLATASAHGYWLDAGEFVSVARDLGVAHPPGQPLAALVAAGFALLPVGPLAYRVAVASAVLAALGVAFFFRAVFHTLLGCGEADTRKVGSLALAAAWVVAGGAGYFLQAVRPEVYALSGALSAVVLDCLLRYELAQPSGDLRPLYLGALALGLALANHHFLALLLLPAAAPTLGRLYARFGLRGLLGLVLCALLGLSTYLYLPLRAAQQPALNLGDPSSLGRFWWVVSAQAFQKNTGSGVPQPLDERLLDVLVGAVDTVGFSVLLLALLGAYVAMRSPQGRRFGGPWLALLLVTGLARAFLGFVRGNPDALGYLIPVFMGLSALAALIVGQLLSFVGEHSVHMERAVAFSLALLAALGVASAAPDASLAQLRAPDLFDDLRRRALAGDAVLIAHDPSTIFRHYGGESEERLRPDIALVPVPFLSYPSFAETLLAREPELTPLVRELLLEGALSVATLQSLAAQRPVYVELDPRVPEAVLTTLIPERGLYRVLPDGTTPADVRQAAGEQQASYDALYRLLGPEADDPQTKGILLWRHYHDALFYAAHGERDAARDAVRRGLARQPRSKELRALEAALADPKTKGPLDIAPFRPGVAD